MIDVSVYVESVEQYIPSEDESRDGRTPGVYVRLTNRDPFGLMPNSKLLKGVAWVDLTPEQAYQTFLAGDDVSKYFTWGDEIEVSRDGEFVVCEVDSIEDLTYLVTRDLTPNQIGKLAKDLSDVIEMFKSRGIHSFLDMARELIDLKGEDYVRVAFTRFKGLYEFDTGERQNIKFDEILTPEDGEEEEQLIDEYYGEGESAEKNEPAKTPPEISQGSSHFKESLSAILTVLSYLFICISGIGLAGSVVKSIINYQSILNSTTGMALIFLFVGFGLRSIASSK